MKHLTEFCHHDASCTSLKCARCGEYRASDIHYAGTVDSHQFQRQEACSCGLDHAIAVYNAMREHIHDVAIGAAQE